MHCFYVQLLAWFAVAACSYDPPRSSESDAGLDAGVACEGPAAVDCLDNRTLRTRCGDEEDVLEACPWGCRSDSPGPRCGRLVPAGGAVVPEDLDPTGLSEQVLSGIIDGDSGEIDGTPATSFKQVGSVAVFRFSNLRIGTVQLVGTRAIALVASGELSIDGVIDVRGSCGDNAGPDPGPGGRRGGNEQAGSGDGAGSGDDGSNQGGGGAGHGGAGGTGGGGLLGGLPANDPQITLLVGGAGGGGGKTSDGGGGGGAIQLVSDRSITIGALAGINAGGCGGGGGDGNADAGGGGGGAGGTILLEAPVIEIAGVLAVNGGSGGNRNNGEGVAGVLGRTRASGPSGGGLGGAASAFDGASGTGVGSNQDNGGGGGGVGRIRLVTGTGASFELVRSGATLSPSLEDGEGTTTTHGMANTR
jgi:hypothetical protein